MLKGAFSMGGIVKFVNLPLVSALNNNFFIKNQSILNFRIF